MFAIPTAPFKTHVHFALYISVVSLDVPLAGLPQTGQWTSSEEATLSFRMVPWFRSPILLKRRSHRDINSPAPRAFQSTGCPTAVCRIRCPGGFLLSNAERQPAIAAVEARLTLPGPERVKCIWKTAARNGRSHSPGAARLSFGYVLRVGNSRYIFGKTIGSQIRFEIKWL
jgi:hypothetical protein